MSTEIALSYFKPSGKWYADGKLLLEGAATIGGIRDALAAAPSLPGLTCGFHSWVDAGGSVLMEVDGLPHLFRHWPPDQVPPNVDHRWASK